MRAEHHDVFVKFLKQMVHIVMFSRHIFLLIVISMKFFEDIHFIKSYCNFGKNEFFEDIQF